MAVEDGFLKQKGNENFQFYGPSFTDPKWFGIGAGIAVRKQDKDLTRKFNAAIDAIRANGVYKKIQDKYFNYNVYGD